MNFLFVDKILELVPGQKTIALKHITATDSYLIPDTQNKPSIMSCIIGEALGQLCSWNVIKSSDFRFRLIGGVVGEVKIMQDAYLGDTVVLENYIDVLDLDNQVVSFSGIAKVDDKPILTVENGLGPLLPVADFGSVEIVKKEFANLYRPGAVPLLSEAQHVETSVSYHAHLIAFDKILAWEKGARVIAQKNISLTAPYFADHFPQKPVLPLSLLMECNMQLGYQFLADMQPDVSAKRFRVTSVRRIKMSDFVQPGDSVTTILTLKECTPTHFVLNFSSKVGDKRVCVAEAEYICL
jgi:3-hydroxymyristoyl/3-hydroxydecanoyl-(acyl carrier protein) dehydratase